MTVTSILANTHPDFSILIVDQSTDDRTRNALAPFISDPRVQYLHMDQKGKSRANNLSLRTAQTEIVAFTDDDCEVPTNWLTTISQTFARFPEVAVVFCNVLAAPYDETQGFTPCYTRQEDYLATSIKDKNDVRGIGAAIAVRRLSVLEIGGYDEMLGPGATFPAAEDGDLTVRALLKGYHVYETAAVAVIHYGFRTYKEGRELAYRNWLGIAAAYSKPLRCGHWSFISVPAFEVWTYILMPSLKNIFRLRKPSGVTPFIAFCRGGVRGWRTSVNRQTICFCPRTLDKDSFESGRA